MTSVPPALLPAPRPMATAHPPDDEMRLRALARELEGAFLSEMLGHAGLGAVSETFGGGIGEEQFGSFLRKAQADAMAGRGGIGLAEHLFRALTGGGDVRN